jgi:GH24 family phage-related lysozyme (muramidase)
MDPSEYFNDLVEHEGLCTFPYCDRKGYVTIGIGNLVATPAACQELPLIHTASGIAATASEKATAWTAVKHAFDQVHIKSAMFYAPLTDLRISQAYAAQLVAKRLNTEFFPALEKIFPGIEGFPRPARAALVDMIYSLGVGEFSPRAWPHLIAACNAVPPNWANRIEDGTPEGKCDPLSAAAQCHRDGGSEKRNTWTSQQFIDAAMENVG